MQRVTDAVYCYILTTGVWVSAIYAQKSLHITQMSIGHVVVVKSNDYLVFADYKVIINLDAHYSLETLRWA